MKLVPQAKKAHKRWTTWLISAAGVLTSLQTFMPSFQQYMHPDTYKMVMIGLLVLTFIAAQIKQPSVSGGDK